MPCGWRNNNSPACPSPKCHPAGTPLKSAIFNWTALTRRSDVTMLHWVENRWMEFLRSTGSPHLSLGPRIPERAAVFPPLKGHDRHTFAQDCKVAARAVLGGLHHEYRWERIAA